MKLQPCHGPASGMSQATRKNAIKGPSLGETKVFRAESVSYCTEVYKMAIDRLCE
jgi:hypothetical protein